MKNLITLCYEQKLLVTATETGTGLFRLFVMDVKELLKSKSKQLN
jgi:hypothetical protein